MASLLAERWARNLRHMLPSQIFKSPLVATGANEDGPYVTEDQMTEYLSC